MKKRFMKFASMFLSIILVLNIFASNGVFTFDAKALSGNASMQLVNASPMTSQIEDGTIVYADLSYEEQTSFLEMLLSSYDDRCWLKSLSDDELISYFGVQDRAAFQSDMVSRFLLDNPGDYLLDLEEDEILIIFGMDVDTYLTYFDTEGYYVDESPTVYDLGYDGYTFNVTGYGTCPLTILNRHHPFISNITYPSYGTYTMICCNPLYGTPVDWYPTYVSTIVWTETATNGRIRDVFWNVYRGSNSSGKLTSLVNELDSAYTPVVYDPNGTTHTNAATKVSYDLMHARASSDSSTAPYSTSFVVGGDSSVSFDSSTGLQKTGIMTVNTGTSYIASKISWPEGVTFHYKTMDTNGNWYWTTHSGSNSTYLSYVNGVTREFYFTAPATLDLDATITISSVQNDGTSTGYYVDTCYILSHGTTERMQDFAFPTFKSVTKSVILNFEVSDGYLGLQKASADTNTSNSSSFYTLSRGTYYVYDSAGTHIGTFETDVNGGGHVVYNSYDPTNVATRTSSANGAYVSPSDTHTLMRLPIDTYTVKEIEAPYYIDGAGNKVYVYLLDSSTYTVSITAGNSINYPAIVNSTDSPIPGYLSMRKSSSIPTATDGNSNYTLARAQYAVYNSSNIHVGTFETDANGVCHVVYNRYYPSDIATRVSSSTGNCVSINDTHTVMKLPVDTYRVVETVRPHYVVDGVKYYTYDLDTQSHSISLIGSTSSSPARISVTDVPSTTPLELTKVSLESNITDGNDLYDLTGSEYTVWRVTGNTRAARTEVGSFRIVNNDGDSVVTSNVYFANNVGQSELRLPYGDYVVMETKAPDDGHYELSYEEFNVSLNAERSTVNGEPGNSITSEEPFLVNPFDINLFKIDSLNQVRHGAGDLEGAVFEVCYYDTFGSINGVTPVRTWYLETKKDETTGNYIIDLHPDYLSDNPMCDSDEFYTYEGDYVMPLGTVRISEYMPPTGYTTEGMWFADDEGNRYDGTSITIQIKKDANSEASTYNVHNQLIEELRIYEVGIRGDIQFVKQDYETRELMANIPFEITSLTTGESHIIYTNEMGIACTASHAAAHDDRTNANDNITDYDDGCVTGVWFGDGDISNGLGALPYDDYIVRELRCDANEGRTLEEFTFSITSLDHGTMKLLGLTTNMPFPELATQARDGNTGEDYIMPSDDVTIIDTVTYDYLTVDTTYRVVGYLMDKDTGMPVLDAEGNQITAVTEPFTTPDSADLSDNNVCGTIDNIFNFDGRAYRGCTFVVFEELYKQTNNGWELVAEHKDIDDDAQTVYFLSLDTAVGVGDTDSQVCGTDEEVTIVDRVWYRGFNIDYEYRIEGQLYIVETGEPLLDSEGNPVTTTQVFQTTDRNGYVDVPFTFDATELGGYTVGIVQRVYWNGKLFIEHNLDLTDVEEMVHFPVISTTAINDATNDHIAYAGTDTVITDTVSYTNVVPGYEYTVKGILMNSETGNAVVVNGENVEAETSFIPTSADGTVDVEFVFDSTTLKGSDYVVFETLYSSDGRIIASHEDIDDENQTISAPSVETTAIDSDTLDHTSTLNREITIIDTVTYSNVLAGREYTITGILMDKDTGEPLFVNNEMVVSEVTFVADETTGSVDLEYNLDSVNLRGKSVVVFENMYYNNVLVATHSDINDENQTVDFPVPSISTSARDEATGTFQAYATEVVTVVDTVTFEHLVVDEVYTLEGTLMDKETGAPLMVDGEYVTSTMTFTPEAANGELELEFTFDASDLKGKDVVVFERLYYAELEIASHTDINDASQTITFVEPVVETTARDSETSTNIAYADNEVTIVDRVEYSNLIIGEEYTVKGILMMQSTGKPLVVNDSNVIASVTFIANESDGYVELSFTFDGSELNGEAIVVFEDLYFNRVNIASHADIEDDAQTVYFPELGTMAVATDNSKTLPYGVTATVVDTVTYEGLLPGKTYELRGTIMDKSTGQPLAINGSIVTTTIQFVADKSNGTIDVSFTFNTTDLAEKELVVYEELYEVSSGKLVGDHKDINDAGQTVVVDKQPEIPSTPQTPSSPQTGDVFPINLYLSIGLLSLGFVIVLSLLRKRVYNK